MAGSVVCRIGSFFLNLVINANLVIIKTFLQQQDKNMGKLIGGIFLIVGTSLGAAMLALPVATASSGFWSSSLLLLFCWIIMTLGALALLEVSLSLPENNNMISMAGETLGRTAQIIAWIVYLVLLGISISLNTNALIFTIVLGYIVYCDVTSVDRVNRAIMSIKFFALLLLIFSVVPQVKWENLNGGESRHLFTVITVAITSFGYASIIPTLRTYFKGDTKRLKQAVLIGSLIPLVCYLAWDLVVIGAIPSLLLAAIVHSPTPISNLSQAIVVQINMPLVTTLIRIFTSVCMFTSFLGVSLGLSDFLADGFRLPKEGINKIIVMALTFVPPLAMVLFKPDLFLRGLRYAGICCVILLVLLPAFMVWSGRYIKAAANMKPVLPGGKPVLLLMVVIGLGIIALGFWQDFIV
ncbi:MAG: tyrP 1 [Gammaproteobacteria bacterium]|nr:tyrP 1 [Gammaproteobacteria bacterium]